MATYYPNATMRPVQTTKRARGDYPPAYNSLGEPWGGVYDQTAYQSGRVNDKFTVDTNPPSEFSQGYVDNMGAPGKNQGTGPAMSESAGERAITEILVNGGAPGSAFRGGWGSNGFGYRRPMQWSPAVPEGPAPAGDPWSNLRAGEQVVASPKPGLVTGSAKSPTKPKSGAFGLFGLQPVDRGAQRIALQQAARRTQNPEMAAAMAKGRTTYVSSDRSNNGVLAENALMPTVSISGNPLRNR